MCVMNDDIAMYIADEDEQFVLPIRDCFTDQGYPVKCYGSARNFIESLDVNGRGVLIIDAEISGSRGFDILKVLKENHVNLHPIVLLPDENWESLRMAFKLGAVDVFCKSEQVSRIIRLAGQLFEYEQNLTYLRELEREVDAVMSSLSKKEEILLMYLAEGLSSKEISNKSGANARTSDVHRHNIFKKFSVHSLPQLMYKLAMAGFYNKSELFRGSMCANDFAFKRTVL